MGGHPDMLAREEVPVCPRCVQPYDPLLHYCPRCGAAVGHLTPNIPFVNIRFEADFFGQAWQRIWAADTSLVLRVLCVLVVLLLAPILLLGLPFAIHRQRRVPPPAPPSAPS